MMKLLDHNDSFKYGTRVLMLIGRNKDEAKRRGPIRKVSKSIDEFDRVLKELVLLSKPGERIYASLSPRDVKKASYHFKLKQLHAEHENDVTFYDRLESVWMSALMQKEACIKSHSRWLIDCDSEEEFTTAMADLGTSLPINYCYKTKNGWHIIIRPRNRMDLSDFVNSKLDMNAMMLWGYDDGA